MSNDAWGPRWEPSNPPARYQPDARPTRAAVPGWLVYPAVTTTIGPVSLERLLALAVFISSALLLLRLGPAAVRSWRIYAGTGQRRQEDAAGRAPAAPPGVLDRVNLLAAEGYHRLGETRLMLPVGERFAWIMAAADAESYAILVNAPASGGLTGIYSAWLDGTWLATLHPRGQAFDRQGLQVRIIPTTLAEAVAAHRAGLARVRAAHGEPRPIRSMADMLALDADYRSRFGGQRLRPLMLRIVVPALLVGLIVLLSLVLLLTGGP